MKIQNRRQYYVYIITNKAKTRLMTGVSGDMVASYMYWRQVGHASAAPEEACIYLVYKECFDDVLTAVNREMEINSLSQKKQQQLVSASNENWVFLAPDVSEQN